MTDAPRPLSARRPAAPLSGAMAVPGDKVISHLALMLGALAVGESRLTGLFEGRDLRCAAAAMRALGAEAVCDGPGRWRLAGRGIGGLTEPSDVLDVGDSGTAAGLLCGALASHDLFAVVTGTRRLRSRPMRGITAPLRTCGASFHGREGEFLPLGIRGARDALPIECRVPAGSAQVKPALLLAGLNAPGWTMIEEPKPTRDHTERMLRHFGADIEVEATGQGRVVRLIGQPELRGADVAVPADPSLAAFPLVMALLVPGSRVALPGVGLNPARTGYLTALREMGADIVIENERASGGEPVGDIVVAYGPLRGTDIPPDRAQGMIDDCPALAVAAAAAEGRTRMRGLSGLRADGGNRLSAIAAMLSVNGVHAVIEGDDLIVDGGPVPGGGVVETGMDVRIAMGALALGQVADAPVALDDGAFVDHGAPGFVSLMRGLGAAIH